MLVGRLVTVVEAATAVVDVDEDDEVVLASTVVVAGAADRLLPPFEQDARSAIRARRPVAAVEAILNSVVPAMSESPTAWACRVTRSLSR